MAPEPTGLPDDVKKDLSVGPVQANLATIPFALPGLLMVLLFGAVHGWAEMSRGLMGFIEPVVVVPVLVLGVMAHELIHGATWAAFAPGGWKSIRFGFNLQALMPYANCRVPLCARHYRLGGLMPGLLLGALPFSFGLLAQAPTVAMIGAFFTLVAAGDFWVLYTLRRESAAAIILDHPTRAGCLVLREGGLSVGGRASRPGRS